MPSPAHRITVLIADDDRTTRALLRQNLANQPDIQITGEADNGVDAVVQTIAQRPDVVIMDVDMPALNGIEATAQIKTAAPGTKVLMLSANGDPAVVDRAFAAGAVGYLAKHPEVDIATTVRSVHAGRFFLQPDREADLPDGDGEP